ncbi:cell envelope biogenesis protein TolA [Octadecabacter sp. G9-8]|uniref:Cell envelope biogenesis protein TolA n=1 Tax=Octadecabacter dasysiphoniae TaxID=2909341 RepID=A0ABS9CRA3_9RHOB|nr:cell envelope biogenesis protein TolA [Octadecabacter dasysiphoniae]MCF2869764.1 cell envelope biogenesis protein TolA [Octadecabacter dasysiphoniae]
MSVGTYLSGTGHAALVVWMIAGWGMSADPLPFEVTEVSVVSGAEFAALTQGVQPDLPAGDPVEIEPPVIDETPPAPIIETPPEVTETPPPVPAPAVETPPEAPDLSVPETIVTDTPPDVPDTPTIVAPPPSAEVGSSTRPVPRPALRVAPEIIAPPPPDATVAPEVAEAATDQSDVPADEDVPVTEETTAPEAAADQIVTEAEEPAFAPEVSSRPQTRPQRAAVAETPTEDAVDPVAAALAAAGAVETPTPTPSPAKGLSGGQLSDGDKAGFLRQIGTCWNTGTLSTGAQNTIIDMVFDMTPDGRPVSASVRLDGFSGGSAADADAAFQTARRALLRCSGDSGYDLPRDQYDQWARVILTVDPTAMRQR